MLLALVAGCGEGAPPLDQLPLRDALRADPQVVAAMPETARLQLGDRLEAGRAADETSDAVDDALAPGVLVTALDDARARRQADALLVGAVASGVARPVPPTDVAASTPLPDLEGELATTTAALEARSLAGRAGVSLRALLAVSSARRLQRVVGWPIGAVAIGDTVYVDAAWLVALAPGAGLDGGAIDGEAAGTESRSAASPSPSGATPTRAVDAGSSAAADAGGEPPGVTPSAGAFATYGLPDAGSTSRQPPPTSTSSPGCSAGFSFDDCADGTEDDEDSCDGSSTDDGGDSCSGGSTDDGGDDCSGTVPDGDSDCRLAPGRGRTNASTLIWVLAPLGYLVGRRR